jgi:hypothetical protein
MSNTLTLKDLQFVVSRIPRDVRELMKKYGLYLGGGFIRETIAQQKPNDIDLFGPNKAILDTASAELAEARQARVLNTDNAITLVSAPRLPVQFITRWLFAAGDDVLASFDFTVCQAVVWWNGANWESRVADTFYSDLAARRLVYTSPNREEAAGGSLMRVRKFLGRGYNIQAESFGAVIARLLHKAHVSGMTATEEGAAKVITGLLREVDPLLVIDGIEPIEEFDAEH